MKKVAVVFLILALGGCATMAAQRPASEESKILSLTEQTQLSRLEAFPLVMEWMAENYNSSKAVIQYQDKEAGTIVGKALLALTNPYGVRVDISYTMTVKLQDNSVSFKFMAGYIENPGVYGGQIPLSAEGAQRAKQEFVAIKNAVMRKLDPNYSTKLSGTTKKEGSVTVWTTGGAEK